MPTFFVFELKPILEDQILEYIQEYEKYIEFTCKKRQFLKEQQDDMKSFIVLELIATYHKKYKYDDFDWVTRAIIRRKATDFTSNYCKRNEDLVFENQYKSGESGRNDDEQTINGHYIARSIEDNKDKEKKERILAFVRDIEHKINCEKYRSYFNDFCREFIEVVIELYGLGYDCSREDLMECMGYEKNEATKFNSKLLAFRTKLKEYLDIDIDTLYK